MHTHYTGNHQGPAAIRKHAVRECGTTLTEQLKRVTKRPKHRAAFRFNVRPREARRTPTEAIELQKATRTDRGPVYGFTPAPMDERTNARHPDGHRRLDVHMHLSNNFKDVGPIRVRGRRAIIQELLTPWSFDDDSGGGGAPSETKSKQRKATAAEASAAKRRRPEAGAEVPVPAAPGTDAPAEPVTVPPPADGVTKAKPKRRALNASGARCRIPDAVMLRESAQILWDKRRSAFWLVMRKLVPRYPLVDARQPADPDCRAVSLDPGSCNVQAFVAQDGAHGELLTNLVAGPAAKIGRAHV